MTAPQITREPRKKNRLQEDFPFFLFLSLLIHATLIILLGILFAKSLIRKAAEKEPPPPEVTLQLTPPPKDRPFMEAKESTGNADKKAPFESNENTKAASETPPDGSLPLPTQQGVVQPALELQNQRHTQGEKPASSAGNQAPPQTPSSPSMAAPQQTLPKPAATPQPTATPQPSSTPLPANMKLLESQKPQTPTTSQNAATQQSQQSPARTASAPGSSGSTKGYQAETRQTVIHGNISNRGRSSVAAEATPIGRYKKSVTDAIGSRWYYYVDERMGLLSIGNVNVGFKVTATGKVSGLHVISSNGNESLTDCSLRSIMDAKLPPIPPEVAKMLPNGCLEIDYSFTIY